MWLGEVEALLQVWEYLLTSGLLTFFPHMQGIGKLAFFLFLPFPDPAIQQG